MADFVSLARTGDIAPGTMRLVSAGGRELVIANVGGRFCAFANACPHSEGPLSDGELDGEVVTCPWHFTRFNVRTGAALEGETDDPVPVFEVRIEGDAVLVRVG